MKILIADDDPVSRCALAAVLRGSGFEVLEAADGSQAWEILQDGHSPQLVILDWMMPGLNGLQVCRKVRGLETARPPYLIVLTSRDSKSDVLEALEAGADEFLSKPFDPMELRARIQVGKRLVSLQNTVADRVQELQAALDQVRTLQGILPICSYCKKIRNDQDYWQQVEQYIASNTGATFTHGICPECWGKHVVPQLDAMKHREEPE
ncbi:MAG: copR [Holophagaceae bacterium]|nr:copR [Holophagaceae bacterium]